MLRFIDATRAELSSFRAADLDGVDAADASDPRRRARKPDALRRRGGAPRRRRSRAFTRTSSTTWHRPALVTRDFAPVESRMKSLDAPPRRPFDRGRRREEAARSPRPSEHRDGDRSGEGAHRSLREPTSPIFSRGYRSNRASLRAGEEARAGSLRGISQAFHDDLLPRSDGSFRAGSDAFAKTLRFQLDDPERRPRDALVPDARTLMADTQARIARDRARALARALMYGTGPAAKDRGGEEGRRRARCSTSSPRITSADDTIITEAKRLLADADQGSFERTTWSASAGAGFGHRDARVPARLLDRLLRVERSARVRRRSPTSRSPLPPIVTGRGERRTSLGTREYNRSMLADLLVHEGMPSQATTLQLMRSNRFHSDVRAVFQNGAFVERWSRLHRVADGEERLRRSEGPDGAAQDAPSRGDECRARSRDPRRLDGGERGAGAHGGRSVPGRGGGGRQVAASPPEPRGQLSTYFYGFREATSEARARGRARARVQRACLQRSPPRVRIASRSGCCREQIDEGAA